MSCIFGIEAMSTRSDNFTQKGTGDNIPNSYRNKLENILKEILKDNDTIS